MLLARGIGAQYEDVVHLEDHLEAVDGLSGFKDFIIGLIESRKNKAREDFR